LLTAFSIAMIEQGPVRDQGWDVFLASLQSGAARSVGPWPVGIALGIAAVVGCLECRLHGGAGLAVGFVLGALTVLATGLLACVVLIAGGAGVFDPFAWGLVVLHVPIAVIEGMILGVTVNFLARVKPELLDLSGPERRAVAASEPLESVENGRLRAPPV